jgi:hypothetical protein
MTVVVFRSSNYNTGYLIDTNLMNVSSTKSSICLVRCSSICHSTSPTELSLTDTPVCFPQYKTSYRVPPRGQRHRPAGPIVPSNTVLSSSFYRNLTSSISPSIFMGMYRWRQNAFSKTLYVPEEGDSNFIQSIGIFPQKKTESGNHER